MQHISTFRLFGSLNDFLRRAKRGVEVQYTFSGEPAIKDAIEAIGVPHPEVNVILVNKMPVKLSHPLQSGDKVEVYPLNWDVVWPAWYELIREPPKPIRFILDVHLGTLAKSLRMLGFDCYYERDLSDGEISRIAQEEQRVVLTRDVGLLKQKIIAWGYWLRSQHMEQQLDEVTDRFELLKQLDPLTRCLVCNTALEQVEKEKVQEQLPPKTRLYYEEFYQCPSCSKVYWKGSHYERMQQYIAQVKQKWTVRGTNA